MPALSGILADINLRMENGLNYLEILVEPYPCRYRAELEKEKYLHKAGHWIRNQVYTLRALNWSGLIPTKLVKRAFLIEKPQIRPF